MEDRIARLEAELDLAHTVIGAWLKARNSTEHSIARSFAKELLSKNNKLAFYKEKSKTLAMMMAVDAVRMEKGVML